MSRIAGLHRPADPRPADDAATVRQMLERFPGAAEILAGPQGAIGRIARAEAAIGGAEAAGLSVVVDGRLINADELRAALPNAGPGDAALVAALVARHGMAGALSYLTGDFAVAVLDPAAGRLWLGRDRFGVKPLYWAQVVGGVAFASPQSYRAHLLCAVRRRLGAATRPVFTLSGGLDSSSVLCAAGELTGNSQPGVSALYTDTVYDETAEIKDVIATKAGPWHPIEIGDDIDVVSIVRQVRLHDEPVATATWLSHLVLAERMAGSSRAADSAR